MTFTSAAGTCLPAGPSVSTGWPPHRPTSLLQDTLLDFYDQVADGRLTLMPADLRAHVYGMAELRLAAHVPAHQPLPAAEASRRQRLLTQFNQARPRLPAGTDLLLLPRLPLREDGGKMGFANATVARLQKSTCLRKLYELLK
ncbi:hypothetical protein ACFQT0_04725 [Hymenobacter humi]|uniref:Uncharacterized protein n=1 Tax=Hymenobacter humi TaxID=1411620 RepID=A0ABW2U2Y6_9BACT